MASMVGVWLGVGPGMYLPNGDNNIYYVTDTDRREHSQSLIPVFQNYSQLL